MMAYLSVQVINLTIMQEPADSSTEGEDAKGNAQPPQALMASHDNYNTMYSALLMATGNRCEIDLHTDNQAKICRSTN